MKGERKICSTIKRSQNIMKMIAAAELLSTSISVDFLMRHVLPQQSLYYFHTVYQSICSFENLFSFSSNLFTYQLDFSHFWPLNLPSSSSLTSLRVSGYTLNAGYRACHVPHASRITTNGTIFTQVFLSVSSEIIPILVTRFLGNEWWKVSKKYFCRISKNSEEKEKEKKKKNRRKLHATCNTQSNKNKNSYNKNWYSFFSLEPLMQPSIVWAALLW